MAAQHPPGKADLLAALRQSAAELEATIRALPEATLARGRYENGWNGRQILAHVASIEWTYPRLIALAAQPAAEPGAAPPATARGGIDSYNERQVQQRAGVPTAELLDEFVRNRAALMDAVSAVDEALLARPVRSAGGISGTLGSVLDAVAVRHVIGHLRDIEGSGDTGEE